MTLRTPGLSELVNLTANESGEELLSEGVVHNLAFGLSAEMSCKHDIGRVSLLTLFALLVLIELETLKGSTAGYEFMRELGFMIWVFVASALSVDLVMSIFRFTLMPTSQY